MATTARDKQRKAAADVHAALDAVEAGDWHEDSRVTVVLETQKGLGTKIAEVSKLPSLVAAVMAGLVAFGEAWRWLMATLGRH